MISRVLVDTGPLVALFSARDQFHDVCIRHLKDIEPQVADMALVHLANRERVRHIFTFDRRDFLVCRDQDGKAFELLPTDLP